MAMECACDSNNVIPKTTAATHSIIFVILAALYVMIADAWNKYRYCY